MAAQVSGPGAYSQRTDTGGQPIRDLPNPEYGEATQYREMQKGAPLSDSANAGGGPPPPSDFQPSGVPQPQMDQAGPEPTPLPGIFDPGDPNIPLTAGAPIGPGPNEVTGGMMASQPYAVSQQLSQYAAGDDSGALAWLIDTLHGMGQ